MEHDGKVVLAAAPSSSASVEGQGLSGPELGAFLDALGEGVYAVDEQGCCTFVNRAALDLLGYEREADLLGRNVHETIHHTRPDGSHFPREACPLLGTLRTGRPVRLESELLWRRDGTSFFAEYSSFPVIRGGSPYASLITFADLSLRQDRSRRYALQRAVSGVLEHADEPGAVQEQLVAVIGSGFGWDAGSLWLRSGANGMNADRAASWRTADQDHLPANAPGASDPARDLALKAMRQGPVAATDMASGTAGGAGTPPRSALAFPVRAASGIIGAFVFGGHRPVSVDDELADELSALGHQTGQFIARQRVEAALRDSEALKSAIMETALDCVVVVDAATRVREFNPAAEQTFGWDRASAIGTELGTLILPAEFLIGHLRTFAAFLDSGEVGAVNRRVEAEAVRAGGERFPVEISVTPLKVGDEALFATYVRDITKRKQSEREVAAARDAAEAANEAKSTFIANMSHELRTPLSAIIGYSEMLQEEVGEGGDPAEFVVDMGKIESNARHLLGLINDVLDLSKIESGKMEVFAEPFEVAVMVNEVAATVTSLLEKKSNRLDVHVGADLGSMRSDLMKLKQMLLNLLSNASKFTENGTVTLSAARQSGGGGTDRITFVVSDSGLGMTPEQMGKLFQRYSQADASTGSKFGGTGLGLSISRGFAEMLGGGIEVASTYGEGSTFTITLPVDLPA